MDLIAGQPGVEDERYLYRNTKDDEGIYYAAGADIIGGAVAAILAVTVLKSALNGPSMWFFTLNITLVPVLVIGVLYLLLAAVIPLIVLHFFNKGTVVERLRTSE